MNKIIFVLPGIITLTYFCFSSKARGWLKEVIMYNSEDGILSLVFDLLGYGWSFLVTSLMLDGVYQLTVGNTKKAAMMGRTAVFLLLPLWFNILHGIVNKDREFPELALTFQVFFLVLALGSFAIFIFVLATIPLPNATVIADKLVIVMIVASVFYILIRLARGE
jgi:hypothetical protein